LRFLYRSFLTLEEATTFLRAPKLSVLCTETRAGIICPTALSSIGRLASSTACVVAAGFEPMRLSRQEVVVVDFAALGLAPGDIDEGGFLNTVTQSAVMRVFVLERRDVAGGESFFRIFVPNEEATSSEDWVGSARVDIGGALCSGVVGWTSEAAISFDYGSIPTLRCKYVAELDEDGAPLGYFAPAKMSFRFRPRVISATTYKVLF
jgi:hypothetical protein